MYSCTYTSQMWREINLSSKFGQYSWDRVIGHSTLPQMADFVSDTMSPPQLFVYNHRGWRISILPAPTRMFEYEIIIIIILFIIYQSKKRICWSNERVCLKKPPDISESNCSIQPHTTNHFKINFYLKQIKTKNTLYSTQCYILQLWLYFIWNTKLTSVYNKSISIFFGLSQN